MASSDEIFDISGPVHLLTSFDWGNPFHRRTLAASLVKGVYTLERDRQSGRTGQDSHAPPWWERFHFQLNKILVDENDLSYFGAIFELKDAHLLGLSSPQPPRYVIAFRGTTSTSFTKSGDMILNIKCIFDKLQESSRFHTALKAVWDTVTMEGVGPTKVWIAGHSLGASVAMVAGRNMAKSGYQLETYLFNPPFIKVPIENIIKSETLKTGIRITSSLIKAGIATAIKHHHRKDVDDDSFTVLSTWKPYVFVNPSDPICAEYIGYYEHREKMEGIGVGNIERIATRNSIGGLVSGVLGRELEPYHLMPTAYMTENISPYQGLMEAHGIRQWWQHHFQWQSKLYKFM